MKLSSLNKKNIIGFLKFLSVLPTAFLFRIWKKNIWIISERPGQARDNGYIFFKYLRTRHPDCNVYYLINKTSADYHKIKSYGNIIQFDSWKHYFFYCLSKIHISAHINGCCPTCIPICKMLKKPLDVKDVFLPHGVSYGISEFCLKKYARVDLFICSGKAEYDNVCQNYGYDISEVAYTGFPRLDEWHDFTVNPTQILIMPTWRLYLAQNKNIRFTETNYCKKYQDLINSHHLRMLLKEKKLKIIFYLHHEMTKFADCFQSDDKNIEIVYNEDAYDIQQLLKESAMLITDYSSVHFDFAYMEKPVVYYQFDKKEFYNKQYSKSFFDASQNGFGESVNTLDELIQAIQNSYEGGFKMEEFYKKRMREFYRFHDKENCKRVYEEIKKRCYDD